VLIEGDGQDTALRSIRAFIGAHTTLVAASGVGYDKCRGFAKRGGHGAGDGLVLTLSLSAVRAARKVRAATHGGTTAGPWIDVNRMAIGPCIALGLRRYVGAGSASNTRATPRGTLAGAWRASGAPDLSGWADARRASSPERATGRCRSTHTGRAARTAATPDGGSAARP
jgi:hypothetical protein